MCLQDDFVGLTFEYITQGCESICETRSERIWNALQKICFLMHSNFIKSLKMGFCGEQKSLKSDYILNSHIPDNSKIYRSFFLCLSAQTQKCHVCHVWGYPTIWKLRHSFFVEVPPWPLSDFFRAEIWHCSILPPLTKHLDTAQEIR